MKVEKELVQVVEEEGAEEVVEVVAAQDNLLVSTIAIKTGFRLFMAFAGEGMGGAVIDSALNSIRVRNFDIYPGTPLGVENMG